MAGLLSDLRFGVRMLLKRAGTSTLAAIALALGIGLTTTMFSIVNGAVLRGLPFEDSDQFVHLGRLIKGESDDREVPLHDFVDWRDRQTVFSDFVAFSPTQVIVSGQGLDADRFRGVNMSAGTLRLLRVAPSRGRDFSPEDERPGAPPVALISHRVWETLFRSDPAAVGSSVRINGRPTSIVGVMPPKFGFPQTQDVWLPLTVELAPKRGEGRTLEVLGRLKPGESIRSATTQMMAIASQLEAAHPENKNVSVQLKSFIEEFIGREVVSTLFTMLGAVFGVLLIACANVTNLQLARALERSREIAIRTAIGAERWRIVRQLLVEGFVLALAGAIVGVGIAIAGVRWFNAGIAGTNPPFWIDIRIDGTVLAFATALAVAAALLSSVLPALRVTRKGGGDVLKDQGRGSTSLRAGRMSRVLVGFAVTLSCALLLVSGLMIKSVMQIGNLSYAFKTTDVLMGRTLLEEQTYKDNAAMIDVVERLEARLNAVVGVRRAALATAEPGGGSSVYLTRTGEPFPPPDDGPTVRRIAVSPAFFDVEGLKATAGRLLNAADRSGTTPVTVITEDLATRYFPGRSPIGEQIRLTRAPAQPWWTIVGVVPTLQSASDANNVIETAFVPYAQAPDRNLTLLLSAGDSPLNAAPGMRQAIRSVDQDLPVFQVDGFASFLYNRSWAFRIFGSLFMAFGLSALLMAAAGLYGVLAYGVRLRTQEIGVRMALGAGRQQVIRMILRQGLTVVGIGLLVGLGIGYLLGPQMSALFFNVRPTDPTVFGLTAAVLLVTGVIASLVPARRAASVDPLTALRDS